MSQIPSMDSWLKEAKADKSLPEIGMFLIHNGIVRSTPRAQVRQGKTDAGEVTGMDFSCDFESIEKLREKALRLPGIFYLRYWMNEGRLNPGDDIMFVLVGGDTRPHVIDALQYFVAEVKNKYVNEIEII